MCDRNIYQNQNMQQIQTMQPDIVIEDGRIRTFVPGFFPRNPFLREALFGIPPFGAPFVQQFFAPQFVQPFFAPRFVSISPFLIQFLPPIFNIPPLVPIPINVPFPPFVIVIRRRETGDVEMMT